jgi:hypothetical protein
MTSFEIQLLLNSSVFVLIMMRKAMFFTSRPGIKYFSIFILSIIAGNYVLMTGRYDHSESMVRALNIGIGFIVGTIFMGWVGKKSR